LLGQTFGTGTFKRAVTTAIEGDFTLIDVGNVVDHGVEKVPIVRNQQQGAGVILEEIFQPKNGVEIQVVGRLIEQQQIRRTHQGLRQVQAHPPAAGEVGNRTVHLFVGETQTGEHFARPRIGGITVGAVQL